MDALPKVAANDIIPALRGNIYVTGTTAPTNPIEGQIWVDTSVAATPVPKQYSVGAWITLSNVYPEVRTLLSRINTPTTASNLPYTISGFSIPLATPIEMDFMFQITYASGPAAASQLRIGLQLNTTIVNSSVTSTDSKAYIGQITATAASLNAGWCSSRIFIPSRAAGFTNKMGIVEWYGSNDSVYTNVGSGNTQVGHSAPIPKEIITSITITATTSDSGKLSIASANIWTWKVS